MNQLLGARAKDAGVVRRMYQRFSQRIDVALKETDEARARQLVQDIFSEAAALPSAATRDHFRAEGYRLDGPLFEGSALTRANKGLRLFVVKGLNCAEAPRAVAFEAALEAAGACSEFIISFHLWSDAAAGKTFMVMPLLPATLDQLSPLEPADARTLWLHMRSALDFLHGMGFAHADVKPANIGVRDATAFVLIDLGSVSRLGTRTASTPAYVPAGVPPDVASMVLDWWMLGTTMGETCCGPSGLAIGSTAVRIATEPLLIYLRANLLDATICSEFEQKLTPDS